MYIDCPNCHQTTLIPYAHEEFSVRCKHCHTAISSINEKLKTHNFLTKIESLIPLKIEQTGTLLGKTYKIMASSVYQGMHDDTEWTWSEWLLMDNNHQLKWLSFSMEEGFLLFDHLENYPLNFKSIQKIPTPEGELPIIDHITAELKNFEGCLPWSTHDFHSYTYYSSIINKTYYSLEVFGNEASLFKGIPINPLEIESGFNLPKLHSFLPWNQKIGYFINQFLK